MRTESTYLYTNVHAYKTIKYATYFADAVEYVTIFGVDAICACLEMCLEPPKVEFLLSLAESMQTVERDTCKRPMDRLLAQIRKT